MADNTSTTTRGGDPRVDEVGRSGIYPASGPHPGGTLPVRGQGELAHPEERQRLLPARSLGPETLHSPLLVLGRAIVGGYFIYNGVNHFLNRKAMTEYGRSKGVPMASLAVLGTGAMMLAGGASVLTGVRPKLGASLIATFLGGVSPMMHAFWTLEEPQQRTSELVNFSKNMALLGTASLIAALPEPWPVSVPILRGPSRL